MRLVDPVAEELAMEELNRRMSCAAGVLNVAHARMLELVAEALESGLWKQAGIRSLEHWLVWQTGVSHSRARQWVRIARRRGELPVTMEAFGNGELSIDQVGVVSAHTPANNDAEVCSLAKRCTVPQMQSVLRRYPFLNRPAPDPGEERNTPVNKQRKRAEQDGEPDPSNEAPTGLAPRYLSRWFDDDGTFHMGVQADAAEGALIEQALREARTRLFDEGKHDVTDLDALLNVCTRSMEAVTSRGRRDRHRVYAHVDTEGAWINAGPRLPKHLIERILCDGIVQPVWTTNGVPINVGPCSPVIPEHMRRLVLDRDRTCRTPGCTVSRHLEIHHVVHREHGGPTASWNLVAQCDHHHDEHHRGELQISGNADEIDGLTFIRADGRIFTANSPPTPPDRPPPGPPPGHRYQHPIGERLDSRWVFFTDPPAA